MNEKYEVEIPEGAAHAVQSQDNADDPFKTDVSYTYNEVGTVRTKIIDQFYHDGRHIRTIEEFSADGKKCSSKSNVVE